MKIWNNFLIKWRASIEHDKLGHYKLGFIYSIPIIING